MSERNFAIRTVRNGTVLIGRQRFICENIVRPDMNGRRFAFGRYRRGDAYEPFVCLWGTAREFKSRTPLDEQEQYTTDNGFFAWQWWYAKPITAKE